MTTDLSFALSAITGVIIGAGVVYLREIDARTGWVLIAAGIAFGILHRAVKYGVLP